MLNEPPPSNGDLHFRIADIPVRVHPFFWLISFLSGMAGKRPDPVFVLMWVVVVTVSILIHELGHAFMQRRFGGRPRIVLHGFGGLAICGDCDRTPRSQILISLAGPGAGFLVAAVVMLFLAIRSQHLLFVPFWQDIESYRGVFGDDLMQGTYMLMGTLWYSGFSSDVAANLVNMLLWINLFWGLVNLLPVYPLDGGQVAREVLTLGHDSHAGLLFSMKLSMGVAVAMAVLGLAVMHSTFMAILFGLLAYNNYQIWQAYTGRAPGAGWR